MSKTFVMWEMPQNCIIEEAPLKPRKTTLKSTRKPKTGEKALYYVNRDELWTELEKYFSSGDTPETRVISNKLGGFMIKIATRYASRPNFSGYYYKQEFISDAVYQMCKYLSKIDMTHPKCNPFSYLTCICYCAFIAVIKKHKQQAERLADLRKRVYEEFCNKEGLTTKAHLEDIIYDIDTDGLFDVDGYSFFENDVIE